MLFEERLLGKTFDSNEELWFLYWCYEAIRFDIIESFEFHPKSIEVIPKKTYQVTKQLKTKSKIVDKTLFMALNYTTDYIIWFKDNNANLMGLRASNGKVWIDVKSNYNFKNDLTKFSILQKVIYHNHNIYINKLVPEQFFMKTWLPEKLRLTKTGKISKKWINYKTYSEVIK